MPFGSEVMYGRKIREQNNERKEKKTLHHLPLPPLQILIFFLIKKKERKKRVGGLYVYISHTKICKFNFQITLKKNTS
jgi:hypothetical protein